MASVRTLAKDLIRIKNNVAKFYQMRSQLQAVEVRMQTVKSTHHMSTALRDVGKTMTAVNKQINLPVLQEMMRDFAKESERLEMTEEMMSDAVDMAVDSGDTMQETDAVVG
jgi:charged multivesicular body protein 2A